MYHHPQTFGPECKCKLQLFGIDRLNTDVEKLLYKSNKSKMLIFSDLLSLHHVTLQHYHNNLNFNKKINLTGKKGRNFTYTKEGQSDVVTAKMCSLQVLTFGWREDIRVGDPMHTRKLCFDAVSHSSPVTLYDCHGMKGNQLWRYRKVRVHCL